MERNPWILVVSRWEADGKSARLSVCKAAAAVLLCSVAQYCHETKFFSKIISIFGMPIFITDIWDRSLSFSRLGNGEIHENVHYWSSFWPFWGWWWASEIENYSKAGACGKAFELFSCSKQLRNKSFSRRKFAGLVVQNCKTGFCISTFENFRSKPGRVCLHFWLDLTRIRLNFGDVQIWNHQNKTWDTSEPVSFL